jgi:hypothetical protein
MGAAAILVVLTLTLALEFTLTIVIQAVMGIDLKKGLPLRRQRMTIVLLYGFNGVLSYLALRFIGAF